MVFGSIDEIGCFPSHLHVAPLTSLHTVQPYDLCDAVLLFRCKIDPCLRFELQLIALILSVRVLRRERTNTHLGHRKLNSKIRYRERGIV
jgi:hypothetical protein